MGLFAPFDGDHLVPSSRRRGGPKNALSSRQPIPLHIGVEGESAYLFSYGHSVV